MWCNTGCYSVAMTKYHRQQERLRVIGNIKTEVRVSAIEDIRLENVSGLGCNYFIASLFFLPQFFHLEVSSSSIHQSTQHCAEYR